MSPIPNATFELDAQNRESLVLDVGLPVLGAWARSVRVYGFRPSMGVSGLSPREVARLRTLGLATSAKATGLFEGANDFRMGFPIGAEGLPTQPSSVEADLGGHSLAPVVADLTAAAFGMPAGRTLTHRLHGFTHQRAASGQGYGGRTLQALGLELGLGLKIATEELGFEPQGLGRVLIDVNRSRSAEGVRVDWKDRGELLGMEITIGAVRPKMDQIERLEGFLREGLWEARRLEPQITRLITPGADLGSFLQVDVVFERGGATFIDVIARSASALAQARRAVGKALAFCDSPASCDETTGIAALSCALAARADLELALPPSDRLQDAISLWRELGARIEEGEAPGLTVVRTAPDWL